MLALIVFVFPPFSFYLLLLTFHFHIQSLESEILRLNHLRDRASENGRKKEYPLVVQSMLIIILVFDILIQTWPKFKR